MSDTLSRLAEVLEARKGAAPDSSYVASLYHKGLNKILEKVGEESVETILAAKDAATSGDCKDLIYETADLWFHSLVMLAALGQHPSPRGRGKRGAGHDHAARAHHDRTKAVRLRPRGDFVGNRDPARHP